MIKAVYTYQDKLESTRLTTRFVSSGDLKWWEEFFEDQETAAMLPIPAAGGNKERSGNWINKQLTRYNEGRYGLQVLIYQRIL